MCLLLGWSVIPPGMGVYMARWECTTWMAACSAVVLHRRGDAKEVNRGRERLLQFNAALPRPNTDGTQGQQALAQPRRLASAGEKVPSQATGTCAPRVWHGRTAHGQRAFFVEDRNAR